MVRQDIGSNFVHHGDGGKACLTLQKHQRTVSEQLIPEIHGQLKMRTSDRISFRQQRTLDVLKLK